MSLILATELLHGTVLGCVIIIITAFVIFAKLKEGKETRCKFLVGLSKDGIGDGIDDVDGCSRVGRAPPNKPAAATSSGTPRT